MGRSPRVESLGEGCQGDDVIGIAQTRPREWADGGKMLRSVVILFALLIASAAMAAFDPALMVREDGLHALGERPGATGLEVIRDPVSQAPRAVVGTRDAWYVLEWHLLATGHSLWQPRSVHDYGPWLGDGGRVAAVRVGDVDADGSSEIVVLLDTGRAEIWENDATTLRSVVDLPLTAIADFELDDADGVPGDDLVTLSAEGVGVHPAGQVLPAFSVAGVTGWDLTTGQVDADPSREIVVAGPEGVVIDDMSHAVEASDPGGHGRFIACADVDADGIDELVLLSDASEVAARDLDIPFERWRRPLSGRPFGLSLHPVEDGSGTDIVALVSDGPATLDGDTGDILQESLLRDLQTLRITRLIRDEMPPGCRVELFAGREFMPGFETLIVALSAPGFLEWPPFVGPFEAIGLADLNADGQAEILAATGNGGACRTRAMTRDRHAGFAIEGWTPGSLGRGPRGLAVMAFDADAPLEWLASVRAACPPGVAWGSVSAIDGVSAREDLSAASHPGWPSAVLAADIDGDGVAEILEGTGADTDTTAAPQLHVRTGVIWPVVNWSSPDHSALADAEVTSIRAADIDRDGVIEVAYSVSSEGLHVIDGPSKTSEWDLSDPMVRCLDVADVVAGGALEILVGTSDGALVVLDGASHAEIARVPLGTGAAHAVRAGDLDGDGLLEVAVTAFVAGFTDRSVLLVVDPAASGVAWTGPILPGSAGRGDALLVGDSDDDGQREILVGTAVSVDVFEQRRAAADLLGPALSGALELTSHVSGDCCARVNLEWTPATDDGSQPLTYEIHRSETPGFALDASTVIGTTASACYQDASVQPLTTHEYAVLARDSAGNASTSVLRSTATSGPPDRAIQPTLVSVTDIDPCASGLEVVFEPSVAPAGQQFGLYVNNVPVATNVTSPHLYVPPADGARTIRIEAVHVGCRDAVPSNSLTATDVGAPALPGSIGRVDADDPCLATGFRLTFTPGRAAGPSHDDLLMDGLPFMTDVVSPIDVPGQATPTHDWSILTVEEGCGRSVEGSRTRVTDRSVALVAPTLRAIDDLTPCQLGSLVIDLIPSSGSGATRHDLLMDGAVLVTGVWDGTVFAAPDELPHAYSVRAVNESCSLWVDSNVIVQRDPQPCSGLPLEVSLRVERESSDTMRLSWLRPAEILTGHDLYVGTLDSLWGARAYDHVPQRPGLSFPGGRLAFNGCSSVPGDALEARVAGLPEAAYLLVVARAGGQHGPFGARSDGVDRHDPTVDPRAASEFCP